MKLILLSSLMILDLILMPLSSMTRFPNNLGLNPNGTNPTEELLYLDSNNDLTTESSTGAVEASIVDSIEDSWLLDKPVEVGWWEGMFSSILAYVWS